MTRVVHVITRMIVGGAQENTLFSVLGLNALGRYETSLVTGPETGSEGNLLEGRESDLRIVYVPRLVRAVRPVDDVLALRQLTDVFRAERPEIVHTHSSKAGVLGRAAARVAKVPVVVHTLHSLVFHDYQPFLVNRTYRLVKRAMVPLTDHYVSVSDNIRQRAIAAGIGSPDRHSTVRSGFHTDQFVESLIPREDARARLDLPGDRLVVGVVARLFPLKGHLEILDAAERLVPRAPEVLFAFVGSGPLRPELEERVRRSGLVENVRFVGHVPPADVPVAFSAFDVLAHASLREGLARVIPQAVMAGLPVVCYDLDGSGEVVVDGVNGFLVPPRDTAALADRLAALTDPALRQELGGKGRDQVREEFSVEAMVRGLDAVYTRLTAA